MRLLLLLTLFLTGCQAAAPATPCQRQCGRMHDTCMDAGGAVTNPQAMRAVGLQCEAGYEACFKACQRPD